VLEPAAVDGPAMTAAFTRLEGLNRDRFMRFFDPFQRDGRLFADDGGPSTAAADPVRWLASDGLLRQLLAPFLAQAEERPALDERLAGVLALIERRLDHPPSVAACAHAAGLAPTWFSDRFAAALGVRPAAWIERRRIRQAQLLLATSDLPIKGVAARLGYGHAPHFARAFRRVTGLSPGAYRRLLAGVVPRSGDSA
jgi:transcriptional regulator GlxA family with amidase domain